MGDIHRRDTVPDAVTGQAVDAGPLRPVLEIYVTGHCGNCRYALETAAWIAQKYPQVDLRVIDLETTHEPIPESVFATPTYLLNGRVWSLGNPAQDAIVRALTPLVAG